VYLKSGLIKGVAFGGSGLIIGGLTFILSVSEIWPDKRGGWSSVGVALKDGDYLKLLYIE